MALHAVAPLNETFFHDRDVEPGVSSWYVVRGIGEDGESRGCPVVEATAGPFLGSPALAALAAAGAVGTFVALRRRR